MSEPRNIEQSSRHLTSLEQAVAAMDTKMESLRAVSNGKIVSGVDASPSRFVFDRQRPIAKGGMSKIYLAYDRLESEDRKNIPENGLCVAKVLVNPRSDIEGIYMARNEGQLMSMLENNKFLREHVIRIKEIAESTVDVDGHEESTFVIYQEYLTAKDWELLESVEYRGTDEESLPKIMKIMDQLAEFVDQMSNLEKFHSDLKDQNIFVRRSDSLIKVGDFGLSGGLNDQNPKLFTYQISSPEWHSYIAEKINERPGVRSEIFSLGHLFYKILTGHSPYDTNPYPLERSNVPSSDGEFETQLTEPHLKIKSIFPNAEQRDLLQSSFERVLAVDPSNRYSTAREFYKDIKRAMDLKGGTNFWRED